MTDPRRVQSDRVTIYEFGEQYPGSGDLSISLPARYTTAIAQPGKEMTVSVHIDTGVAVMLRAALIAYDQENATDHRERVREQFGK